MKEIGEEFVKKVKSNDRDSAFLIIFVCLVTLLIIHTIKAVYMIEIVKIMEDRHHEYMKIMEWRP